LGPVGRARGQHDALVLAHVGVTAVGVVVARLALQHDEGVVFVRMRVQTVLAARGIDLERRPHVVGLRHQRIRAPLSQELRTHLEERRLLRRRFLVLLGRRLGSHSVSPRISTMLDYCIYGGIFMIRLLAAVLLFGSGPASPQPYPVKPVKLIVPFAPGGGSDVSGRFIAQKLSTALGQQVVVENRAGAGGLTGAESGTKSPPDGYTLTLLPSSYTADP